MKVTVVGTGYVGLVTGTCLADLGNQVTCIDIDPEKINSLRAGKSPIFEPGLEEVISRNQNAGRLKFSTQLSEHLPDSDIVFIAVGTPEREDGQADVSNVKAVVNDIGKIMVKSGKTDDFKVIVNKSTVPVGMGNFVRTALEGVGVPKNHFGVVSNPEFLREGSAVSDFFNPDRIVLGSESQRALEMIRTLYTPLQRLEMPILETNLETAELIKYSSNAFLATKVSFINEMANLCDLVGADVQVVAKGMGLDDRIGPKFLQPGPGFGGSCFPKDTNALIKIAKTFDYDLKIVRAVREANAVQHNMVVDKAVSFLNPHNSKIAVLGLAFKANTDDMREAPAIPIIQGFVDKGIEVRVYDPIAQENAKSVLPPNVIYTKDEYEGLEGADLLVVLTEWHEFRVLDFNKVKSMMAKPQILDARNIYNPDEIKALGFNYKGIGRK